MKSFKQIQEDITPKADSTHHNHWTKNNYKHFSHGNSHVGYAHEDGDKAISTKSAHEFMTKNGYTLTKIIPKDFAGHHLTMYSKTKNALYHDETAVLTSKDDGKTVWHSAYITRRMV